MADLKKAFKALPHVNKVWVTEDGEFHLHPNNGGEEVTRESVMAKEKIKKEDTGEKKPDEQP